MLKDPEEAQPYLDELRRKSPEIASAATLAREFCRIIRERDTAAWPKWCEETKTSLLATSYPHRPKGLVEARGGSTPWGSQYKISNPTPTIHRYVFKRVADPLLLVCPFLVRSSLSYGLFESCDTAFGYSMKNWRLVPLPECSGPMSALYMFWEKALELATRVSHPYAVAAFVAVIAGFVLWRAIFKKSRISWALGIGLILLGLAPIAAQVWQVNVGVYHIHVVVLGPDQQPAENVQVTCPYGEAAMVGLGRWEIDVAPQTMPGDGKLIIFAKSKDAYLVGSSELALTDNWFPQTMIQLRAPTSALVRGTVQDESGRSVEGVRVSIVGYSDVSVTDSMGNFSITAHAAEGQMVQLRAEKGGKNAQVLIPAGPGNILVLK